jgi:hypothetical protein
MTEDNIKRGDDIEALERLLASHGADRTRWPAPERLKFAGLLATDAEAKRLLREAAVLDRLLDLAPRPSQESASALAGRIVAAATAEAGERRARRPGRGSQQPAPWIAQAVRAFALRPGAMGAPRSLAAGLLAASLLIGAFAGSLGALDSAIDPINAATSDDGGTDADATQLALGSDEAGLLEEDLF